MKSFRLSICSIQILCLLVFILFVISEPTAGAEAAYLTILVPGALGTFPMGINNSMTVTGYYTTSPTTASAFIRDPAGTISTFNIRGGLWTEPESINNVGDIAGFYELVAGSPQSFIRYADGRVVTFDPPPGAIPGEASVPIQINKFGEVAGDYLRVGGTLASLGYIRSRTGSVDNVAYDRIGGAYQNSLLSLNSSGTFVGYVEGVGYFADAKGYGAAVSVPVSGKVNTNATIPEAINDSGVIAGWYGVSFDTPSARIVGGFVRSPQGEYTVFNPPGTLVKPALGKFHSDAALTAPTSFGLNSSGVIAGTYTDAGGTSHGFVRNPYGTITPFDPPRGIQTTVSGINDSGIITGSFYYDWNAQTSIGFLRIPKGQSEDGAIQVVAH